MSKTFEFWMFLIVMLIYSVLPISVLHSNKWGLQSNDPSAIPSRDFWWNRNKLLPLIYAVWLITPVSLTMIAIVKFLNGEYPAQAVFVAVAELVNKHGLASVLWEGVIAGACSVFLLRFSVSERNGLERLRSWCLQHVNAAFFIAFLIIFLGQLALINFALAKGINGVDGN